MKAPLKTGDKVRKWSSWNERLGTEIWTVGEVRESISQSGYVCNVYIDKCEHCGAAKRKINDYDCNWYVKVTE